MRAILPLLLTVLLMGRAEAARLPILLGWGGETIRIVVELPQAPQYTVNGRHVDIAVLYKSVSLFLLPIWQYDLRWVAAPSDATQYFDLERSRIESMARGRGVTLPERPYLGFWAVWGGKLVLLGLLTLLVSPIFALRRA